MNRYSMHALVPCCCIWRYELHIGRGSSTGGMGNLPSLIKYPGRGVCVLTTTGLGYLNNTYIFCSIKGNTSYCTKSPWHCSIIWHLKGCERAICVKLTRETKHREWFYRLQTNWWTDRETNRQRKWQNSTQQWICVIYGSNVHRIWLVVPKCINSRYAICTNIICITVVLGFWVPAYIMWHEN